MIVFPSVAQFIQQLLNACYVSAGRLGVSNTKRTTLPVEETDVEIGDCHPLKRWNIDGRTGYGCGRVAVDPSGGGEEDLE